MDVLILAAGTGSRLESLTHNKPKAMVQVLGRELIAYVMDFLDHPAIQKRFVITGFEHKRFETFLQERYPQVQTLHNPRFCEGSILTLERGLAALQSDVLLMNVDHLYPKRMLGKMLQHARGITAVCDFDRKLGADDMKIQKNAHKQLVAIHKQLRSYNGGYIGMTMMIKSELQTYKEALTQTKAKHGDGAPVEWILGELAASGYSINICDTSGVGWLEVDDQQDLRRAEHTLRAKKDFLA